MGANGVVAFGDASPQFGPDDCFKAPNRRGSGIKVDLEPIAGGEHERAANLMERG